jgi:hypothetical protein
VLLEKDFTAKVTDFGLARVGRERHSCLRVIKSNTIFFVFCLDNEYCDNATTSNVGPLRYGDRVS